MQMRQTSLNNDNFMQCDISLKNRQIFVDGVCRIILNYCSAIYEFCLIELTYAE